MSVIRVINFMERTITVMVNYHKEGIRVELHDYDPKLGRVCARIGEGCTEVALTGNVSELYIVPKQE